MSHFSHINLDFKDEELLIETLIKLGWTKEQIEVCQQPIQLFDYMGFKARGDGDRAEQKAHVVIRATYLDEGSNDLGFVRQDDGSLKILISAFDQGLDENSWKPIYQPWEESFTNQLRLGPKFLPRLKRAYAEGLIYKTAAANGQTVERIENPDRPGVLQFRLRSAVPQQQSDRLMQIKRR